jgi:murein DD-endopeptidase MepM/ murein hydrolase activator NlpD
LHNTTAVVRRLVARLHAPDPVAERRPASPTATRRLASRLSAARSARGASADRTSPDLSINRREATRQRRLTAHTRTAILRLGGPERLVPIVVAALVLVASSLSVAATSGSAGGTGNVNGAGDAARIAIGGYGAYDGAGPVGAGAPGGDTGSVPAAGTSARGLAGAVAGARALPGLPDPGNADEQAPLPTGPYLADGTLLKPVAVDTTVADGSAKLREYRVRSGDTLTGIAARFGVSMMSLWWANDLKQKDELHVGQTLVIPPVSGLVVTVKAGDTLASIARDSGVSADAIVAYNGLTDPAVVIGQRLIVPGGQGPEIAPPTPAPTSPPTAVATSRSGGGGAVAVAPPRQYSGGRFAWPVPGGYISQYFHPGHLALDIAADIGTPIDAAADGTVLFAGWRNNGGGYQVWLSHGSGLFTAYYHMSAVTVGAGEQVGRGQQIGRIGMTGWATGPHCHFEVWIGGIDTGTRVNPLGYL